MLYLIVFHLSELFTYPNKMFVAFDQWGSDNRGFTVYIIARALRAGKGRYIDRPFHSAHRAFKRDGLASQTIPGPFFWAYTVRTSEFIPYICTDIPWYQTSEPDTGVLHMHYT